MIFFHYSIRFLPSSTSSGVQARHIAYRGEISPQRFGHNLEHTRRAVWQGLSARMLASRKFAGASTVDRRPATAAEGFIGRMRITDILLSTLVFALPTFAQSEPRAAVFASSAGAHLDSDLVKGGGTDDTQVLQAVLDRAATGGPLHLIIDGAALTSGLEVYGNTTIECLNGAGLYLKDNSRRAVIRNKHRSRDAVTDEHITVRGCFFNGNREGQPSAEILRPDRPEDIQKAFPEVSNKEPDGTYMAGLQFFGVNDLTLDQVTVWGARAFGIFIANGQRITIRDVTVDHGGGAEIRGYFTTDGLHFKGPLRYVSIDGLRVHVGDDAIAFNADDYETDDLAKRNDFGPYIRSGPITDVTVNNLQLMDTLFGIRILSAKQRVDRLMITHVTGTVRGFYFAQISHWMNDRHLGNVGSVMIADVNVDRIPFPKDLSSLSDADRQQAQKYQAMIKTHPEYQRVEAQESNFGIAPFINVNAHVEHLVLNNVMTKVVDDRPILRFGRDATVQMLEANLHLFDPKKQATPIKLDDGAHIEGLTVHLDWQGCVTGSRRRARVITGSSLGGLHQVQLCSVRTK